MRFVQTLDKWFVDGWRSSLRWWSVWMHTIGTALAALFLLVQAMPHELQQLVPVEYRALAIAIWYIGGLWARLKDQRKQEGK